MPAKAGIQAVNDQKPPFGGFCPYDPIHFIREGSVIVLPSTTKRPLPR